ncbi:MAG: exonuclease domain-containing protein [Bacilli bacterium]|nr:exonuclease domain-containing protein [Bacilli bacterium]
MKELEKELRGYKILVFVDLEGTQFTHEMIEIGAHKVVIKDDGSIKRICRGYKAYVKPKSRIGKVVTDLTGITEDLIKKEGVPYRVALQGLQKYLGKDWNKCLFVVFGNFDAKIFQASSEHNMDASKEDTRYVVHHIFDYSSFISRYVKDEHGNPYSLSNYLTLFNVKFKGQKHDALADAYNLALLYKAFLENKDIVANEYKKVLYRNSHTASPVQNVIRQLSEGKTVTPESFDKAIRESLE